MSSTPPTVVWFESDLRTHDNPALTAAVERGGPVIPVYIQDEDIGDGWADGEGVRWWLRRSLAALDDQFGEVGLKLIRRRGQPGPVLADIADSTGADTVRWNGRLRPARRERADSVAAYLNERGLDVGRHTPDLLHDPDVVETTSGGPYHVYTPFWNKFRDVVQVDDPLPRPNLAEVPALSEWPRSHGWDELGLSVTWNTDDIEDVWTPGEPAALSRLKTFTDGYISAYDRARDRPDQDGTSRLSPRLRTGEVSPRQVWAAAAETMPGDGSETYLQEIVWREFSYHLLHHYPETTREPLRDKFRDFDWRDAPDELNRWQRGQTGYPIVDAGMRQLAHIGWMHNRVRMIVASFLTKDLRIHWLHGAEWFWQKLVDADLANNTMGWQWAAGCGADAQPFFRIFNPVSQGERHDPNGDYVRRWVPELADLPNDVLHAPWRADSQVLDAAGVTLGDDYPPPIVDHSEARDRALDEYNRIK
jgi:deoxyribodipyrimidine photo-lyase